MSAALTSRRQAQQVRVVQLAIELLEKVCDEHVQGPQSFRRGEKGVITGRQLDPVSRTGRPASRAGTP
eukprot:COSAG06_NODE_30944_length_529_cov_1.441860_1_plen_68_part_00